MSIYTENGYESRADYLHCMSDEYSIDIDTVETVADLLGSSEDFDELLTTLQDMREQEDASELEWLETNSLESMEYTPAWTRQPRRDNKFQF